MQFAALVLKNLAVLAATIFTVGFVAAVARLISSDGSKSEAVLAALLGSAVYGLGIYFPLFIPGALAFLVVTRALNRRVSSTDVKRLVMFLISPIIGAVPYAVLAPQSDWELPLFVFGVAALFAIIASLPQLRGEGRRS